MNVRDLIKDDAVRIRLVKYILVSRIANSRRAEHTLRASTVSFTNVIVEQVVRANNPQRKTKDTPCPYEASDPKFR